MVGNLLLRGMLVGVIAGLLGILRLKSALRLEWRSQDAQHKEDQRYHAARIADSLTPPTRMRFSGHTSSSPLVDPLNQNYLTATGQRVPRPSVSQGAATTQPERKIKDKTKELDLAPIRQMT